MNKSRLLTIMPVHDDLTEFYDKLNLRFLDKNSLFKEYANSNLLFRKIEDSKEGSVTYVFIGHGTKTSLLTGQDLGLEHSDHILNSDVLIGAKEIKKLDKAVNLVAFCCSAGSVLADTIKYKRGRFVGFVDSILILAKNDDLEVIDFYKSFIEKIFVVIDGSNEITQESTNDILDIIHAFKAKLKNSKYRIHLRASLKTMEKNLIYKG